MLKILVQKLFGQPCKMISKVLVKSYCELLGTYKHYERKKDKQNEW